VLAYDGSEEEIITRLAQTPMPHLSAPPPGYAHSVVASDEKERATPANGYGTKAALESKLSPQRWLGCTARVPGRALRRPVQEASNTSYGPALSLRTEERLVALEEVGRKDEQEGAQTLGDTFS
jgi:hypothetical protein